MAKKGKVKETLDTAAKAKAVWLVHPDFKIGEIGLTEFAAAFEAAEQLTRSYASQVVALTGVRVRRDDKVGELLELVTRFRSGVRATYGPDSAQYEQAGAVRRSARKSPKARTTVVTDEKVA